MPITTREINFKKNLVLPLQRFTGKLIQNPTEANCSALMHGANQHLQTSAPQKRHEVSFCMTCMYTVVPAEGVDFGWQLLIILEISDVITILCPKSDGT